MVEFKITVNQKQRTAYINKKILETLGHELVILPNCHAGALYPETAQKKDVVRSLEIILEDLKHQVEMEKANCTRGTAADRKQRKQNG